MTWHQNLWNKAHKLYITLFFNSSTSDYHKQLLYVKILQTRRSQNKTFISRWTVGQTVHYRRQRENMLTTVNQQLCCSALTPQLDSQHPTTHQITLTPVHTNTEFSFKTSAPWHCLCTYIGHVRATHAPSPSSRTETRAFSSNAALQQNYVPRTNHLKHTQPPETHTYWCLIYVVFHGHICSPGSRFRESMS